MAAVSSPSRVCLGDKRIFALPAYDIASTLLHIPADKLALTLGGSRETVGISHDQIRRLTGKAGLPLTPVARIVRDTAEATAEAWKALAAKDLLPAAIRNVIDAQIDKAAARTRQAMNTQF